MDDGANVTSAIFFTRKPQKKSVVSGNLAIFQEL
jgi:hypothetical protein